MPEPKLLILDEPANGLDPQGIIEIRELLIRLNQQLGITIFVSSHLLSEIEKTCTHIGIIHQGVMRYQDTLQEMKKTAYASGEVIFKVANAGDWLQTVQCEFPQVAQIAHDELLFSFSDASEVSSINRRLVMQDVPVLEIKIKGGLEEWFMQVIKNNN